MWAQQKAQNKKYKTYTKNEIIEISEDQNQNGKDSTPKEQGFYVSQVFNYSKGIFKQQIRKTNQQSQPQSQNSNSVQYLPQPHKQQSEKEQHKRVSMNSKKRKSNFITSNIIRTLMKCIKDMLNGSEKTLFSKVQHFKKRFQINSQVWGYDILLTYLLFLKDIQKCLLPDKYYGIIQLTKSKLCQQKNYYQQERQTQNSEQRYLIKQYDSFINHLSLYADRQNDYNSLCINFEYEKQIFFEKVIKKRVVIVKEYLKRLKQIQNQLNRQKSG